jgi:hypothetical protein
MSAYMAFLTSFILTLLEFFYSVEGDLGKPYPSGIGNFPATVSEGVSKSESAQGRLFFAFGLIAGICIFLSWYPFSLRNVYTGNEDVCGCGYWIGLRQFVPPIGLLILICVPTVPAYRASGIDYFSILFHLIGAGMMFVGYLLCELKCLEMFGFKSKSEGLYLDIEDSERHHRQICAALIAAGFGAFLIAQVVLSTYPDSSSDSILCCHDKYEKYAWFLAKLSNGTEQIKMSESIPIDRNYRTDSATGWFLAWKMISFLTECLAGLAMVTSHLLIWYNCEERHVDYAPYPLLDLYDEECDQMTQIALRQLNQFASHSKEV